MNDIVKIKSKCDLCSSDYIIAVPNTCAHCYMLERVDSLRKIKERVSKWYNFKRFAYYVLFIGVPMIFVGLILGLKIQLIVIFFGFWNEYIAPKAIKFFMKIF